MSINKLYDVQFKLKLTAKQLARNSNKCEKEQKNELDKCLRAIEKGNIDGARIYGENSIRKKKEALMNLRLSARLDAVVSRLDSAIKMKMVTKSMGQSVRGMDKVLESMDPVKINAFMNQFEMQFETMDVTSGQMVNAIGNTVALATPQDEVDSLLAQVADAHGIDLKHKLNEHLAISGGPLPQQQAAQAEPAQDDLEARFAQLRGM